MGTPVILLLSSQKCQGIPFPPSVKIHYFCSGPIRVDPICPQPTQLLSPFRVGWDRSRLKMSRAAHRFSFGRHRLRLKQAYIVHAALHSHGIGRIRKAFLEFSSVGVSFQLTWPEASPHVEAIRKKTRLHLVQTLSKPIRYDTDPSARRVLRLTRTPFALLILTSMLILVMPQLVLVLVLMRMLLLVSMLKPVTVHVPLPMLMR